ncbi:MAG: hypothetical protein P8Y53_19965 [Pseudolabrys sp.]
MRTADVFERPLAVRPHHDSIDAIVAWLIGPARRIASGLETFDEFAWRLLATGIPLLRVTLHGRTLHPQYLGTSMQWWRTTGKTAQIMIGHEVGDTMRYEDNPVLRVALGGETLRRRLDGACAPLDFPILQDLKAEGATDYLALPVPAAHGDNYMLSYVTDRPGGFTDAEIDDLKRVSQFIAGVADMRSAGTCSTPISVRARAPRFWPATFAAAPARRSRRCYGRPICAASPSVPTVCPATA